MKFIGLFVALCFVVLVGQALGSSTNICFITDLGCIAKDLVPDYDPARKSIKEWSSSEGFSLAVNDKIITQVRFDQKSIDVLKNGLPYGIEIEAVLSGPNSSSVTLDHIYSDFPSSAHAGRDTQVLDSMLNGGI